MPVEPLPTTTAVEEDIEEESLVDPEAVQASVPTTKPDELITDSEWETFLLLVVSFLNRWEKKLDILDFMSQIKMKVEDCSRAYTGMWILDMLHQGAKDNFSKLGESFQAEIDNLQRGWDVIMERIRPARKNLLGSKCIEFFFDKYKYHSSVATREQVEKLADTDGERWFLLCKRCNELGLNNQKPYQNFVSQLMVEMTKY